MSHPSPGTNARPAPDLEQWEWQVDPTLLSLNESAWRTARSGKDPGPPAATAPAVEAETAQQRLPSAFCTEVGRRLLLAELEFSEWVLRRIEKVRFDQDRSVCRQVSIELVVRADAPVFLDCDGTRQWLVPLSVMRRRTLVNLDIRDESGTSVTGLGMRVAQKLDQSVLKAAAEAALQFPADALHSPGVAGRRSRPAADAAVVDDVVKNLITGVVEVVDQQVDRLNDASQAKDACLSTLAEDPLFSLMFSRFRRNFTLYVLLPVSAGRRRRLTLSFDEPTDWAYQMPQLARQDDGSYEYKAGRREPSLPVDDRVDGEEGRATSTSTPLQVTIRNLWARLVIHRAHFAAAIGWNPTRIRFQVPGAECAASYHFEFSAPPGVRIIRGSLLAGRPNDPRRHVSVDDEVGDKSILGLRAIEVPNGSLCRVQIDLRLPSRGWLSTIFLSCWVIFFVMLSVARHLHGSADLWTNDRITNVVLLLVTVSAGCATYLIQRDAGGAAARTVTFLRGVGALAISLPAMAAVFLVYTGKAAGVDDSDRYFVDGATTVSFLIAVLTSITWIRAWLDERNSVTRRSPLDMTRDTKTYRRIPNDYLKALTEFHFDAPAVGVASAEGWHERYAWDDAKQCDAVMTLHNTAATAHGVTRPYAATRCRCHGVCAGATVHPLAPDRSRPDEGVEQITLPQTDSPISVK